MKQEELESVRDTWGVVFSTNLAEVFYDKLFLIAPESRALFPNDIPALSQKLTAMLSLMVAKLDQTESLREDIKYLSERHAGEYKAKAEYFEFFNKALLSALSEKLGDRYTKEVENAWKNALRIFTEAMLSCYPS